MKAKSQKLKANSLDVAIVTVVCCLLYAVATAHCAEIPDTPAAVKDASFWAVVGLDAGFSALDAYTTVSMIGRRGPCFEEVGNPELYGRRPQELREALVMGGLFAAATLTTYALKKRHVRLGRLPLWMAPSLYESYSHALGGIHNLRACR